MKTNMMDLDKWGFRLAISILLGSLSYACLALTSYSTIRQSTTNLYTSKSISLQDSTIPKSSTKTEALIGRDISFDFDTCVGATSFLRVPSDTREDSLWFLHMIAFPSFFSEKKDLPKTQTGLKNYLKDHFQCECDSNWLTFISAADLVTDFLHYQDSRGEEPEFEVVIPEKSKSKEQGK